MISFLYWYVNFPGEVRTIGLVGLVVAWQVF